MFELEKVESAGAQIKVIGVGGCGCNAVNNMISAQLKGVEFLSCNTDIQTLRSSLSSGRIQISQAHQGLGRRRRIGSAALESEGSAGHTRGHRHGSSPRAWAAGRAPLHRWWPRS